MFASCEAEREPAGDKIKSGRQPPPVAPFGLHALWRAYRVCRKGKRNSRDTQAYEASLLDKLVASRDALARWSSSGAWHPSRTYSFIVSRPKLREIHAAPFADRVVHHVLVNRLARIYEPVFIHDSYANRLGKGTHAAVDRLQGFMRQASAGGSQGAYALQLDIANFFNSIHRPTLFRPIGNLTSQFFANVYLNALDQFVKHQLKARWYVRYVDDFVLLHPDPAQLLAWRGQIEDFLRQRHSLKLKSLAQPHPLQQGTDFLGYVIRPFYRLARRRVLKRLQCCLRAFARQHVRPHALDLPPGHRVQRPGLGPCTEWPLAALPLLRKRLMASNTDHLVVAHSGHFTTGFKRRSLSAVWLAQPPAQAPFLFTPLA